MHEHVIQQLVQVVLEVLLKILFSGELTVRIGPCPLR